MVQTPQTLPGITSPTSHVTTLHGVSWETYTNIDKKAMYQDMKVPEFWSYDGKTQQTSFYVLSSEAYQKLANSATFPFIQQDTIAIFIKQCEQAGE